MLHAGNPACWLTFRCRQSPVRTCADDLSLSLSLSLVLSVCVLARLRARARVCARELALEWEESQRKVMYDPSTADYFLQYLLSSTPQ